MSNKNTAKTKKLRQDKVLSEQLRVEELEERVALSVPTQKKSPQPAPYMPGTDYGLIKRKNLKGQGQERPAAKLRVEELEERVALSVPVQKKSPQPSPYMPGTLYGLIKRDSLNDSQGKERPAAKKLKVEELEERVALSVPVQKKSPQPSPYMPGTRYGLIKRDSLKPQDRREPAAKKLKVEELEERVALSVPAQKKSPQPSPYMPGTRYGLIKRGSLKPQDRREPAAKKLEVEELEERVALSVPAQKKSPQPAPYMPGTYYGLVKRSNL